jgi:Nucleotidyltransferase of unknown function (DUF6036)
MTEPGQRQLAEPLEPWRSFLGELDGQLSGPVELHCLGGFVVTQHYGLGLRETVDIDFLPASIVVPTSHLDDLAGQHSVLHRRHGVYLQQVTVVTPPCDYATRLQSMFADAPWRKLRLYALDPTDLALSKLERNAERDREDYLSLYRARLIDPAVLRDRYFEELRPYLLTRQHWHDQTLDLWIEIAATQP